MFVDITERRRAEEALRESESLHRALVEAIPDILLKIRRRDETLEFRPTRDRAQLDFDSQFPVEASHRDLPEDVMRQFRRSFELAMTGITSTLRYQLEIDSRRHVLEARLVPRGQTEVLAIVRDLTDQRELERQLQESQRLEALGRVVGGVAHDFNNLLTVITGNAELTLAELAEGDNIATALRDIVEVSRRATDLIRQLLAFSRKQVLRPRVLNLNVLVSGMEKMLTRVIGEDVVIETRLEEHLGAIRADPGQMEQVLMNLAVNARDAMPNGGTLAFETENLVLHETYGGYDLPIPSGRYVRLIVSDTGEGMDEETRSHVFEPFFTTKERGKGTGLGLSTVYGIVKQSGGFIWVYSEVGSGTVLKIYFPQIDTGAFDAPDETRLRVEAGRGETILLVEDETRVLDLARSILEKTGYDVIPARNGAEARNIAEEYRGKIDLIATDIVMPGGINGRDLADTVQALRPGVKALFMSGYTDDAMARYGALEPGSHFLEKPYSPSALLDAVRRALDAG